MKIKNKIHHDPVTELPQIEAYMRYALLAAEKMIGVQALTTILQDQGMEKLIGNYPPDNMQVSSHITLGDYSNLCMGIIDFYGQTGREESIRFGHTSTKPALERQGKLFNFGAKMALKILPLSMQVKTVLDSIKNDLEKLYEDTGYSTGVTIEDRGESWAYVDKCCAVCAGKESNEPICWSWVGTLEESVEWLTNKKIEVAQIECRSMGADACVWEVSKTAK